MPRERDRAYFIANACEQILPQRKGRDEVEYHLRQELAKAYREGYAAAVREYAVWSDGEQLVGTLRRPLAVVLKEIETMPVTLQEEE